MIRWVCGAFWNIWLWWSRGSGYRRFSVVAKQGELSRMTKKMLAQWTRLGGCPERHPFCFYRVCLLHDFVRRKLSIQPYDVCSLPIIVYNTWKCPLIWTIPVGGESTHPSYTVGLHFQILPGRDQKVYLSSCVAWHKVFDEKEKKNQLYLSSKNNRSARNKSTSGWRNPRGACAFTMEFQVS